MVGFLFLHRLTRGQYYDVIGVVTIILGFTILFYVGYYIRPKAAYATGVAIGFVYLIAIVILWLIIGLIVYWIFGNNILDLYIDLENLKFVWIS